MTVAAGFDPVIDAETRILILGSFPGTASLAASQYYAHPRNQFWRLISALINCDLVPLPYAIRLDALRNKHIGLWDVIADCTRKGSLDSAIRAARVNNLALLPAHCPRLKKIGFNGKTAGKFAPQFSSAGFDTIVLPSSSPAYASLSFERKLTQWRKLLD